MTLKKPSVETLLTEAIELESPEDRALYVEQSCQGDIALKIEVQRLLANHFEAGKFLETATPHFVPPSPPPSASEPIGKMIGPYKLLELIGEGGMGLVYMAEQSKPVRRRVALKLVKPGMDTKQVLARFDVERQALAMMEHPNIARVLDAGTTEQARPYFVMELVRGISIIEFCDQAQFSTRERLVLFQDVCAAVQHAHMRGIIHRDLKPTNVLVTMNDDRPLVKVIDFGIAKATNQQLTEKTLFTAFQQMIGTPLYMSPEQAQMNNIDVDTRSDVYSLGVMLYELITGEPPFDREQLQQSGFDGFRRLLLETDPPRPSQRVSTLRMDRLSTASKHRKIDMRRFSHSLRGELDWIVMKSIEKDRRRRYNSASDFADDIERFLTDQAVQACPPSLAYRLSKFSRRYRAPLATAAALLFTLLVATAFSIRYAYVASAAKRDSDEARTEAIKQRQVAIQAAQKEQEARQDSEQLTQDTRRMLSTSYVSTGAKLLDSQAYARSLPWFVESLRLDSGDDEREYIDRTRIGMVLDQCPKLTACFDLGPASRRLFQTGRFMSMAFFDSNGRAIALRTTDRTAQVFDIETDQTISPICDAGKTIQEARLSPDGRYLCALSGRAEGDSVRLWETRSGRQIINESDSDARYTHVEFSPNGRRFAAVQTPGLGRIWDTNTGQLIASFDSEGSDWIRLCVSHDGETIAWSQGETTPPKVSIWNKEAGLRTVELAEHARYLNKIQFSPDDKQILTASFDTTARVFDFETHKPVGLPMDHDDSIQSAIYSADGLSIATVSWDHTARIWNAKSGEPLSPPLVHDGELRGASFSDDGRLIVTASSDTTARIWHTATGKLAYPQIAHHTQVIDAKFDSVNRRLMTVTNDGIVHLWDLASAHAPATIIDTGAPSYSTKFMADSGRVWTANPAAQLWNSESGEPLSPALKNGLDSTTIAFSLSQDCAFIATQDYYAGNVQVWDTTSFKPTSPLLGAHVEKVPDKIEVTMPGFRAHAKHVLAQVQEVAVRRVAVWDFESGNTLDGPLARETQVETAAYSPDGKYIVLGKSSGGSRFMPGGELSFWDAESRSLIDKPIALDEPVRELAFTSDSQRVAVIIGRDLRGRGEVHIREVPSGRLIGLPIYAGAQFLAVKFSKSGRHILTASRDLTARIWDVETAMPVTPPFIHSENLSGVSFSDDDRFVLTSAGVGNLNSVGLASARLWDVSNGQPVSPPLRHSDFMREVLSAEISSNMTHLATSSRDGTTMIWNVSRENSDVLDLAILAEVLSGREMDSVGSLSPMDGPKKMTKWNELRSRRPEWFKASQKQINVWHHSEAVQSLNARRYAEGLAHLQELASSSPYLHDGLRRKRIDAAIQLAKWDIARSDLAYFKSQKDSPRARYEIALLSLLAHQTDEYSLICTDGIKHSSDESEKNTPQSRFWDLWSCVLAPNALSDYSQAVQFARQLVELEPNNQQYVQCLGGLLLRAGLYEEALTFLDKSIQLDLNPITSAACANYFLANAHQQLGHLDEAQRWLVKANVIANEELAEGKTISWDRRGTIELLRQEAESLIRPSH